MKKSRDKESFIKKPEYPGGRKALDAFITKHLEYPADALQRRVEGKVYVSFWVTRDGSVSDVKVLKSLGHGCDEEAVRLVKLLQYSPQNNHGQRVTMQRRIYIHFRLPKPKSTERTVSYSYKESEKKGGSYSYTVDLS